MKLKQILLEAIDIQGHELSAQNEKFQIRTPQGRTYAYEMEFMNFKIPIYDVRRQGTEYIMKYGQPSIGLSGLKYETKESPIDATQIAGLFKNLGQPELPLVVKTEKGEKSVTFVRA